MKIWIDVLTPKQVNFAAAIARRLKSRGHSLLVTSRDYREVNRLCRLRRLRTHVIGKHGGGELYGKLLESTKRSAKLAAFIRDLNPNVSLSFASPEAARVSFGLTIPHVCVTDSPHAEAVCKLTVPLSRKLIAPNIIPKNRWVRYGIRDQDVVTYRALDAIAWLRPLSRQRQLLSERRMKKDGYILVRPTEEKAAYVLSKRREAAAALDRILECLTKTGTRRVVVLPRYSDQLHRLRKRFGNRVEILASVIDGLSVVSKSACFIGGGGTMTVEASLMGVPTVSYLPFVTHVEKWLVSLGLVRRSANAERAAALALRMADNGALRSVLSKKAWNTMSSMEDPLTVITKTTESLA